MLESMVGLRATKKRRMFDEILANGVALFREQGIRRTRTDQIAKAAAVSSATLFNYFPNKGALAEAWVGIEERGLRPSLRSACRMLAERAADAPALRLEAWRTAGRAREQDLD